MGLEASADLIRRTLRETDEFAARSHHPTPREIDRGVLANWRIVITGVAMVVMTCVSFYTITAYTPTFGKEILKLTQSDALLVTLFVGLSNLFWLPVMGSLSDRIGRRPLLVFFTVTAILTAYPTMTWLVSEPSSSRLLLVELWLSFIYASYNGAMVPCPGWMSLAAALALVATWASRPATIVIPKQAN